MNKKRILSIILVFVITLTSFNGIVFASTGEKDLFSLVNIEKSTISELQSLAQKASNDTEARQGLRCATYTVARLNAHGLYRI